MKKGKIIAVCICTLVFAAVVTLSFCRVSTDIESQIAQFLNRNQDKSIFFAFFTNFGEVWGVVGVILVFLLIPATRKNIGFPTALTVTSSWLLNTLIKNVVHRARPTDLLLEVSGYSFPSGHAMNNAALYLSVMLLVLPLLRKRWQKITVAALCTALPLMIGLSRVYFNVHFASDVLCGWSLGAIVAISGTQVYFNLRNKALKD